MSEYCVVCRDLGKRRKAFACVAYGASAEDAVEEWFCEDHTEDVTDKGVSDDWPYAQVVCFQS